tara:strand:- start:4562 stop:4963 length:402 start_codon:yes stop_codon:yes gene_type:complete
MATVTLFDAFVEDAAEGVHNLAVDTLKVALTNTAPSASNTVIGDITQIAAGNGYATGGVTATVDSSSQTGGVYTLTLSGITWTASGGDIATNRYAVLYNNTATDRLIAYADFGVSAVIANGNTETANGDWLGA